MGSVVTSPKSMLAGWGYRGECTASTSGLVSTKLENPVYTLTRLMLVTGLIMSGTFSISTELVSSP